MTLKIMLFMTDVSSAEQLGPWIPTATYQLKTAYDLEGQCPQLLEWLPSYMYEPDHEKIWQAFVDAAPDIVLLSLYMWSLPVLAKLAQQIKQHFPQTVVIAGGPDIEHRTHEKYVRQHAYFDYICYGDGEQTFIDLMDVILQNKINTLNLLAVKNLIFVDKKNKVHKTVHEVYKGKIYTDYSPYLHCKDLFLQDIARIKEHTKNLFPVSRRQPQIGWETDRGCPYKCTFCDWALGLHQKVTKKKYAQFEELTLFAENECNIFVNNANFGIYKTDIEILKHAYSLQKSGQYGSFFLKEPSWAKLNLDRVQEIHEMHGEMFGWVNAKVALQSISSVTLANIDRPAVSWNKIKQMILDLRKTYKVTFGPELIVGLPGETTQSWNYMLHEFIDLLPIMSPMVSHWHMLPNSPGFDSDYQTKFDINIHKTIIPALNSTIDVSQHNEDQILALLTPGGLHHHECAVANIAWQNYSMDIVDNLYMWLSFASTIWCAQIFNDDPVAVKKNLKFILPQILKISQYIGKKIITQYDKHGYMPGYLALDNKIYSFHNLACLYVTSAQATTRLKSLLALLPKP